MTIRTSKQAIAASAETKTNTPGYCQLVTRGWFNAPSSGDVDRDGDSDAVDGWLSEPSSARHTGDRHPPAGKPLSFGGGSRRFGHRAMSWPNGKVRSTDFDTATQSYRAGIVGTADSIEVLERAMGVHYLGYSDTIDGYPIPDDPKPEPKSMDLHFGHLSMQFSDFDNQHAHDANKLFARGFDILTGTEAGHGAGNLNEELREAAREHGYRINLTDRYDTWVAVKRSLIKKGSLEKDTEHLLDRSSLQRPRPPGTWGDKAIVWLEFENEDLGVVSVGSIHNLTRGGAGADLKEETDEHFAEEAGDWARQQGRGPDLAFIAGDMNLSDKRNDVFFGEPLTTCWDELGKYPDTGHGTIDVIASFDKDHRVKCVGARVRNDDQAFFFGDHYLVSATYRVHLL